MELSLITNEPEAARAAEDAGIERIMVDLEKLGKAERQAGRGLFLSAHTIGDVSRVKGALRRAKLTVRIDPPHPLMRAQIGEVIGAGADFVMLPYFDKAGQAGDFLDAVGGRAVPVLLVERAGAVAILPELCALSGVAEIHVGLNDLSISQGRRHWFDVLETGLLNGVLEILRRSGLPFGFGGIGSLSRQDLPLPPGLVLAEQVLQGATRGWLGRSFREVAMSNLKDEVNALRREIERWESAGADEKETARHALRRQIAAATPRVRTPCTTPAVRPET